MTKKFGLALAILLAFGLGGCGDDDGGGEGGGSSGTSGGAGRPSGGGAGLGSAGSGSTSTGNTADDIAMCMMMGSTGTTDCEGIDEYTECVQEACADEYETCLGPNYKSGNFSGGMCESLADCTEMADDPCSCDADAECINCFVDNLVSCSQTCPLPSCGGGGGTAGTGSVPQSDKTCDDLEACCMSLDDQIGMACLMQFDAIKSAGNVACSAAYSAYAMLGCK